jgi:high-affinity nickel-transport protein
MVSNYGGFMSRATGLIGQQCNLHGPYWSAIDNLNDHFGAIGLLIIGIFAISWMIAAWIYRLKRYDDLNVEIAGARL